MEPVVALRLAVAGSISGRDFRMCGIVGILGTGPVAGSIVDALKRLEYRGYDSAGVATLESGRLARRRAEGKLKNLEAKLAAEPLGGAIGIGHTRWATHGKPTETNAHPHASPRLAVVHNGIIENFRPLRQELAAKGYALRPKPIPKLRRSSSRTNSTRASGPRRRFIRRSAGCAARSRSSICSRARRIS
jgi:glutamate synthase domain-containing protein 1